LSDRKQGKRDFSIQKIRRHIVNSKRSHTAISCLPLLLILLNVFFAQAIAQKQTKPLPLYISQDRKLAYTPDSLGNRIPDFSYCGYRSGEYPIPDAAIRIVVPLTSEDATLRIQSAIDYVSKLPADSNGLRGAVLLQKGKYLVNGSLRLHTSGVVLRGSGSGENSTIVYGEGKTRETLLIIQGKNDRTLSDPIPITDEYVPVNANTIHTAAHNLRKGDRVIITRPSTSEWINTLGTDHFGGGITSLGWKPGQRNIEWRRIIKAVDGNVIILDAPLTTALDKKYGGGTITAYSSPGMIEHCGIENLQLVSAYDSSNSKDEDHRWMAITINNANDSWVRQVNFKHFAGSAVAVYENASRITVEDCISIEPISEIGGERRNTFYTTGQQTLFQRCFSESGIHDFATGFCAAGPNAFVQCESLSSLGFSGGLDSWSSGVLFDIVNIDGNAISYFNRGQDGQGAGWNIANSVLWNCTASRIDCYQPPTAQNWSFGSWSQFAGNGYWGESNNTIEPRSLYYAQLKERIGASVDSRLHLMKVETEASSSPTVEQARELTNIARTPLKTLRDFISSAGERQHINITANGIRTIEEVGINKNITNVKAPQMQIQNAWLVRGNKLVTGSRQGVPWWSGTARPYALKNAAPAITRFVPGRTGKGLTDDLEELTDSMRIKNIAGIEQNYGLWYDRRRDDHERIRRMDGDVWAPFYELPFSRSGQGLAWDGLSKYDLTRYNHFYWQRLKTFADLADRKGLLLVQQHYFQHNIIEAGAHYTDFPWRTANNINNTGFPEPVPYAGDKRIFMAEQFYDTTNAARTAIHRSYIRQNLSNFRDNNGVIHTISEEFTGPAHFVRFWLNVIKEWKDETGSKPLIALSVTKDVQDSILADPEKAAVVDIIDIRYWHYQADGNLYAPRGGQNLAPRQHARLLKPKASSPQQVYRAVKEYRLKFPGKAVMYSGDSHDRNGWAVLMAGGSLPAVKIKDEEFLQAVAVMQPLAGDTSSTQWTLFNGNRGYVIYAMNGNTIDADLRNAAGKYSVSWINTNSGEIRRTTVIARQGQKVTYTMPANGRWALWLKKQ
ncbi:MAG TPA: DUF6298 domain-containing protein, partial [Chitinophagaceae bacterium]